MRSVSKLVLLTKQKVEMTSAKIPLLKSKLKASVEPLN